MVRGIILVVALSGLVSIAAGCRGDEDGAGTGDDGRALIEKAIEAMGGDAALAKVRGGRFRSEGEFTMGAMTSPYTSEMVWIRPDRIVWEMESGGVKGSMGLDGETAWSAFMAPAARVRGPAKEGILEWPLQWDTMLLRPLLHRDDVEIRSAGTEGDEERVQVIVGGKTWTLGFRTEGGATRMVSATGPVTQQDGRMGTLFGTYSEPKEFDGITLPSHMEMEIHVDGKVYHSMKETILEVEWNPEVTDETFRMPELSPVPEEASLKDAPAFTGLVVVHEGPYDTLSESFEKAFRLAGETGVMFLPQATCIYLNDPSAVADPKDLRTQVIVPLMVMGEIPKAPEGSEIVEFEGIRVAGRMVRGPYGATEGEVIRGIMEWLPTQELGPGGPPRVVYFHDPSNTVPEDQLCEVQVPVAE